MARNRRTAITTTGDAQREDSAREIRELRGKIRWIDGLTTEATGFIDALARAARTQLEKGDDLAVVYSLLIQISGQADTLASNVSLEAGEVEAAASMSDHPVLLAEMKISRRWTHDKKTSAADEEGRVH
jgi:hypothetical protein